MTVAAERVRDLLNYNPETGEFTWRVRRQRVRVGAIAGTVWKGRYRQIIIDRNIYPEHRLAWFYVHGKWPSNEIDHIDGNGLNNRICNLREASKSENGRNQGPRRNNKTGLKGVSWSRHAGKWQAQITLHGISNHLGYFDTPEAAHQAYSDAAEVLHGEFRRVA